MPPPKGSVGADGQGQQMAFRRAKSTGGNATAEQARAALVRAFEAADLDRSGMIDKEELANIIKNQLHVQLTDPVNDIDIIFDSLDDDKSGLVSMDEFCKLFEPTIARRASSAGTMDIEELMKETFSGILIDAKVERSVVIQGFMKAHHEIEKSGRGFGKGYWGNKWRFKIFDGFYTHPKDPETGNLVDVSRRFYHLIGYCDWAWSNAAFVFVELRRLEATVNGSDSWLNKQLETDEEMKKEVTNQDIIKEYCQIWVGVLKERQHEVEEAQAIRRAASQ